MKPTISFRNVSAFALACACALAFTPACWGQYNIFLRVTGVPGESAANGHAGDIEGLGFSLGVSNTNANSGGGLGRPTFADVSVAKYVDKASPLLMLSCAQGTSISSVVLFVQSTSPTSLDFYKVTLTNARVTGLDTGGAASTRPTETVSFTYDTIEIIYTPRNANGTPGTPVRACFNRPANTGC